MSEVTGGGGSPVGPDAISRQTVRIELIAWLCRKTTLIRIRGKTND